MQTAHTSRVPGQVAPTLKAPLVLFTYYNPILRRGVETFIADLASAGVSGAADSSAPLPPHPALVVEQASTHSCPLDPRLLSQRVCSPEAHQSSTPSFLTTPFTACHHQLETSSLPPTDCAHPRSILALLLPSLGLLIPDIPLEETEVARRVAATYGIELVLLSTPTTSDARMAKISAATSGFVYLARAARSAARGMGGAPCIPAPLHYANGH